MSYDIYGNPLRRGHCEVHPHVHEEYPCSVCIQENNNRNAQQQSESEHYETMRLEHELELSQQRITELVDALDHIARVAKSSRTQSRRDRWICLRANCAISGSDEWETADLPKIIENSRGRELRLRAENNELAATVERLREALNQSLISWGYIGVPDEEGATYKECEKRLEETPQQNLNAVKRELILELVDAYTHKLDSNDEEINQVSINIIKKGMGFIYPEALIEYANTKCPSDKE